MVVKKSSTALIELNRTSVSVVAVNVVSSESVTSAVTVSSIKNVEVVDTVWVSEMDVTA